MQFTTEWTIEEDGVSERVVATLEDQVLTLSFTTREALVRTIRPTYHITQEHDAAALARVLLTRLTKGAVLEVRESDAPVVRHPFDEAGGRPIVSDCPLVFRNGVITIWNISSESDESPEGKQRLICRCGDDHRGSWGSTCDITPDIGRPGHFLANPRARLSDKGLRELPYISLEPAGAPDDQRFLSEIFRRTVHEPPSGHEADLIREPTHPARSLIGHSGFKPHVKGASLPTIQGPHASWNAAHNLASVFEEEGPLPHTHRRTTEMPTDTEPPAPVARPALPVALPPPLDARTQHSAEAAVAAAGVPLPRARTKKRPRYSLAGPAAPRTRVQSAEREAEKDAKREQAARERKSQEERQARERASHDEELKRLRAERRRELEEEKAAAKLLKSPAEPEAEEVRLDAKLCRDFAKLTGLTPAHVTIPVGPQEIREFLQNPEYDDPHAVATRLAREVFAATQRLNAFILRAGQLPPLPLPKTPDTPRQKPKLEINGGLYSQEELVVIRIQANNLRAAWQAWITDNRDALLNAPLRRA